MTKKIYAIYKNGEHKGNEAATCEKEAITKYIIASLLGAFLKEDEFLFNYSAVEAIDGIHYYKNALLK